MTRDTPIQFSRTCPRCRELKPITDFPRNRSKPDGRGAYCKPCNAAATRDYYSTPEGKRAVRESQRRSLERARARYAAAVADLSPSDRARLGLT